MNTERTTYFLMANLGSELIRCFASQRSGNGNDAQSSAQRAFRIMDQLMAREDMGNGKQEVALLKKLTEDSLTMSSPHFVTEQDLNSYFMPFASRALAG